MKKSVTKAGPQAETNGSMCDKQRDIATASPIEVWIDETERRTWFLFEASRHGEVAGSVRGT